MQTVISDLQQRLSKAQGVTTYLQPAQDLTIDARQSRTQYQFTVQSTRSEDLATWIPKLVQALSSRPEITNLASDWQDKGLQVYVDINRDAAAQYGVTTASIDNIFTRIWAKTHQYYFTQTNQYHVVLGLSEQDQNGLQALQDLYVPSSSGACSFKFNRHDST